MEQNDHAVIAKNEADDKIVPAGGTWIPPPPKKKRYKVLEEENYVKGMEEIIQRDYFPDLPRALLQREWQEALLADDTSRMRDAHQKAVAMSSTRRAATEYGGRTPVVLEETSKTTEEFPPPNMRLDKYLSVYSSEDNAAFEKLLVKTQVQLQQKHPWIAKLSEENQNRMIEAAPVGSGEVVPWQYKEKNMLFYSPEGVPQTTKEEEFALRGPPKEITPSATRLPRSSKREEKVPAGDHPKAVWGMISTAEERLFERRAAARDGPKVDLDQLNSSGTSRKGNYGFVATPSPRPSSPITTWGHVCATPLLLDPPDIPDPGPFKVPDQPPREVLAKRLSSTARQHRSTTPRSVAGLSPAVRGLFRGKNIGDQQLRDSYRSPWRSSASASPAPLSRSTPQRPASSTPRNSITDGLLQLPSNCSQ